MLSLWRRALSLQEEQWSSAFEKASSTDAFARTLGLVLQQFLASAESSRERVERSFEAASLPSRADIAALAARIDALTSAVDALAKDVRRLRRDSARVKKVPAKPEVETTP